MKKWTTLGLIMTHKITMDIKLAAHILLDSELKGRFDVQGNLFETTFGYINQYLDLPQSYFWRINTHSEVNIL